MIPLGKGKKWKALRVQDIISDQRLIFQIERRILEEVLQRPPLFNFRLDMKAATPDLKFQLYMEVTNILDDEFDVAIPTNAVENTWNQYRLLYIEYTNKLKLPSGSGTNVLPKIPKHYDVLQQLDFVYTKRNQLSTTSAEGFELVPPKGNGKGKGKGKGKDDDVDPLIKSATDLFSSLRQQPSSSPAVSVHQKVPTFSSDDHRIAFYYTMLPDFRKLNKKDAREFKIRVLGILDGYISKYKDSEDSEYSGDECECKLFLS